jgi:hypothetical protein
MPLSALDDSFLASYSLRVQSVSTGWTILFPQEVCNMPDKPFPRTEGDLHVFVQNLATRLPAHNNIFDFTTIELAKLESHAVNLGYIRALTVQVNDSKHAFTDWKQKMLHGDNALLGELPTFPEVALPEANWSGLVPFVKNIVKRIKAHPGYNEFIGEDLGLIVDNPTSTPDEDMIPEIELKAINNGKIEIRFKRAGFDSIRIDWRPKGEQTWQLAGVYTNSPAVHDHASPGDAPEAREYRAIFLRKNEAVSKFSSTYNIVTTP